jgi:chloride channel protein, CIC family
VVAAALVGALAATTAVGVRTALDLGLRWLYGADDVVSAMTGLPWFWRLAAPALGGVLAGLLAGLATRAAGHGVADVMEAVALGRGRIPFRATALKALGSIAAALGGGSIGREGPIIQLGASVGTLVGERASESAKIRRSLIAAGTAAGFAAAYNTPLAAILFVLEIVLGVVTLDVLVPVAVATAVGTALTRALVGGGPIYGVRTFDLASPVEYLAFAGLGVAAAIVGVGFVKLLAFGEEAFAALRGWPRWARAGLGGLLVGLVLCALPAVAGNGYEPVRAILDGGMAVWPLLLLGLAKAAATTASVGSGSPGGVFTPAMLLGAVVGGVTADVVARFLPIASGGYALVGMAAVVAATTHAPLMAAVLAFELSGDYAIVLPLILATAVATLLSRALGRDSIYSAELRRKGIPWEGTLGQRLAHAARARDLMDPEIVVADESDPLGPALCRFAASRGRLLYVVGAGPVRAISLTGAKLVWAAAMRGEALDPTATCGALATEITTVAPDDSLLVLGEKLWNVDWGELPVVDPSDPTRPLGVVTRRILLGAFDRELLQRDVLMTRVGGEADYLELPEDHRIEIVPAPPWMHGKGADVGELRSKLGVTLVAIRRDEGDNQPLRWLDPDPGVVVGARDRLVVIATEAELTRLRGEA